MFQKDDFVMYGGVGVCRVAEVGPLKDPPEGQQETDYYTLEPVFGSGAIYSPVDSKVFMRPISSRQEVCRLIAKIPQISDAPFITKNQKLLCDHYQAFMRTHDCEDLVQLIKSVYAKQQFSQKKGKKLGETDQRYCKMAESLLHVEFAVALDLQMDQVQPFIFQAIQRLEADESPEAVFGEKMA